MGDASNSTAIAIELQRYADAPVMVESDRLVCQSPKKLEKLLVEFDSDAGNVR